MADGRPVPVPPGDLRGNVGMIPWPRGQVIHRIHLDQYGSAAFNPGAKGDARFSPIRNRAGASIPTLYGGTSFDCAAMETVFHDVPFAPGLKTYDKSKLDGQIYAQLTPNQDLTLIDLSNTALRRLGLRRAELIDTEADTYPLTRAWAEAFHAQCPEAQGLTWISRQDDRAQALMLFGDRVPVGSLAPSGAGHNLLGTPSAYADLIALARRIGVLIVS